MTMTIEEITEACKTAIDSKYRLGFEYQGNNDESPTLRVINPHLLAVNQQDHQILMGTIVTGGSGPEGSLRQYRLDRMKMAKMVPIYANEPDKKSNRDSWRQVIAEWVPIEAN
jgi:predicted DNA-binding transcriptional regulator YafY